MLVVAAFSTGINFLFFLVYLLARCCWPVVLRAARAPRRRRLPRLNPRTHVGEVLQAVYRVDNETRWTKPWVELWNESILPARFPAAWSACGARAAASGLPR